MCATGLGSARSSCLLLYAPEAWHACHTPILLFNQLKRFSWLISQHYPIVSRDRPIHFCASLGTGSAIVLRYGLCTHVCLAAQGAGIIVRREAVAPPFSPEARSGASHAASAHISSQHAPELPVQC